MQCHHNVISEKVGGGWDCEHYVEDGHQSMEAYMKCSNLCYIAEKKMMHHRYSEPGHRRETSPSSKSWPSSAASPWLYILTSYILIVRPELYTLTSYILFVRPELYTLTSYILIVRPELYILTSYILIVRPSSAASPWLYILTSHILIVRPELYILTSYILIVRPYLD